MEQFRRKPLRRHARSLVCLLFPPSILAAHTDGGGASTERIVPMSTYREYAHEVCMDLAADVRLRYRLSTPHPLELDFHHHSSAGTSYLLRHRVEAADSGQLDVADAGHYCFTMKNAVEPPAPFSVELHYQVL